MAATRVRIRLLLPHADEAVALGVSAAAHLLLLALLAGFGARSAALGTSRPVRPVMAVDLAPAARRAAQPAARPQAPPREEPERPLQPEPEPPQRAPTRRHADAPPPESAPPPDTTARTRTLPEAEPVPPAPGPAAPQTEARAPDPDAPAGTEVPVLSLPGGAIAGAFTDDDSFRADWYVNLVHARLADAWRERPVLPRGREALRAVVAFRIMKSGEVREVRLAIPSGFAPLDQSALRAVDSLGRLPALPRGFEKESVPARFVFELVPGAP